MVKPYPWKTAFVVLLTAFVGVCAWAVIATAQAGQAQKRLLAEESLNRNLQQMRMAAAHTDSPSESLNAGQVAAAQPPVQPAQPAGEAAYDAAQVAAPASAVMAAPAPTSAPPVPVATPTAPVPSATSAGPAQENPAGNQNPPAGEQASLGPLPAGQNSSAVQSAPDAIRQGQSPVGSTAGGSSNSSAPPSAPQSSQ
jgi:hypothetical protein